MDLYIHNNGPLIVATNYSDGDDARAGFALFLPDSIRRFDRSPIDWDRGGRK